MKIIPLGVGSAFTMNDYQSNLIIEQNGKRLLIDAGTDIRFSLDKQGLSYKDIDAVYISHLHADHAGGVEYLAFTTCFDPTKEKLKMFGHSKVLLDGWNHTWSGGLLSLQCKVADLGGFFDTKPLQDNGSFMWEGIHFDIVQSVHNINGYSIVHSYGLMIHEATSTKKIFFTSDTQHNPNQIQDFYCKIIIGQDLLLMVQKPI